MNRVKWKGPFVNNNLLKKIKNSSAIERFGVKVITRNSLILPTFIGSSLQIHNGKIFITIKISKEMIGHKLGEFVPTRKQFFHKKK